MIEKEKNSAADSGSSMGANDRSFDLSPKRFEEQLPQCKFGTLGICCNICLRGPCRIGVRGAETGVCGARDYTIVGRNLIRKVAAGTSAHAYHGKHLAHTLRLLSEEKAPAYSVGDKDKLFALAGELGITADGGTPEEVAKEVAKEVAFAALEDFSRIEDKPLTWAKKSMTEKRFRHLQAHALMPSNIESTVLDIMHRTHEGMESDPVPLLFAGLKASIADYVGSTIATDLSDVMFGTPKYGVGEADLGVLKEEMVNIAVHGHNPVLSEVIAETAGKMNGEAKKAGAKGINLVGICCTGNELLMRRGIPLATNFAMQELPILTGMIEAVIVDIQCIMPSIPVVAKDFHTKVISTMPEVIMTGAVHIPFSEEDAEAVAREIITIAINAYKRRDKGKVEPKPDKVKVIAGFSVEQLEEIFSLFNPGDPYAYLIERMREGKIRGIALLAGCTNEKITPERGHLTVAKALLKNDIMVITTGCSAATLARHGLMSDESLDNLAGEDIKSVIKEMSEKFGRPLPPIFHIGSCVDNTRAHLFATRIANRLGVDVHKLPVVASAPEPMAEKAVSIGSYLVTLGWPTHVGVAPFLHGSELITEVAEHTTKEVFGGHFIFEEDPEKAAERLLNVIKHRRWRLGWEEEPRDVYSYGEGSDGEKLTQADLFRKAIDGSIIATGYAQILLDEAIKEHGRDKEVGYPGTGYELPCFYGWTDEGVKTLGDLPSLLGKVREKLAHEPTLENALVAGEATMWAAEIVEALKYLDSPAPYSTESSFDYIPERQEYCGFVEDQVLRRLGLAFVDDTIPGCLVFVGKAKEPKALVRIVKDAQGKGLLLMATHDIIKQLEDENIKMGTDIMLYPLGEFTQVIHGLNFAIRAALSFGNVRRGDRERLFDYLDRRPKVVVVQLGPIDDIKAAAEFAVLFNGSPTITDQEIEEMPGKFETEKDYDKIISRAIEIRDMKIKLSAVDVPVSYGPAFEGEAIRKPQTYLEAGGAAKTTAFELLRTKNAEEIEDGRITVIGKEVEQFEEGEKTPLAILVDVYGKRMQKDFETVLERRIHQFLNMAEGVWHNGQRNILWLRLSRDAVSKGFKLRHMGEVLRTKLLDEFGEIISRVQVAVITDGDEVKRLLPAALEVYEERDRRMGALTDESVDTFYTCELCQSFAPNHICIVTPERLGLCGAVNWLDAKASHEIAPTGPNAPVVKGEVIDEKNGQWEGVNDTLKKELHGRIERFSAYSMMVDPMTSCGCFEVIVAMSPDMQGVVAVNREYPGMTPLGMTFSTLAGSVGGGNQTPGFMGIGRKYLLSRKFISGDGGFLRIAWMPSGLKEAMRSGLQKRAEELGVPDFLDKIADETVTTTPEELMEWMRKVDHPALKMPPLLS